MNILNFGSLNYDIFYKVDHIVMPGETISSSSVERFCGGKGLNQSIALARAGASVFHAGAVGDDGGELTDILNSNGVNTDFIINSSSPTGQAVIQVDNEAQNAIILFGGANMSQEKEHIKKVIDNFNKGDYIVLQNEINHLDYIIDCAYYIGMKIFLNPSPFNENILKCDLNKVSVFLINEIEGEQITGETEPEEILKKMKKRFPDSQTVLTLGSDGAYYQYRDKTVFQKAFKTVPVDTTGAGDTFTGYFICGLAMGKDVEECLLEAAKAAKIAVSRKGAAPSVPVRSEVV